MLRFTGRLAAYTGKFPNSTVPLIPLCRLEYWLFLVAQSYWIETFLIGQAVGVVQWLVIKTRATSCGNNFSLILPRDKVILKTMSLSIVIMVA